MTTEQILNRIDELISIGNEVLSTRRNDKFYVPTGAFNRFRSASLSFLERTFGVNQTFYKEFISCVELARASHVESGISIFQAVREEVEKGWLFHIKGVVSAEIFSDFLEMAEHLLNEGYKDPAAVMSGSILEEHLRKLCEKNDIPVILEKNKNIIHKKADLINHELAKSEVYNKLDMKQITSWLDLRNKAAHGQYDEYSIDQVKLMLQGISDFMVRTPV